MSNTFKPINGSISFEAIAGDPIVVSIDSREVFLPGFYFDRKGHKIDGKIMQQESSRKILFKSLNGKESTIPMENIDRFTIGIDSFEVMNKFIPMNKEIWRFENPEYASVLISNDSLTLYYHRNYAMAGSSRYYLKYKEYLYEVPINLNRRTKFLKEIFNHSTFLHKYINSILAKESRFGDSVGIAQTTSSIVKSTDLQNILNTYILYSKYLNGDTIYLNTHYSLCNKIDAKYYGLIENFLVDDITISYYNLSGEKILTGNYSSFFPQAKKGVFEWYHLDGSARKRITFSNNYYVKDTIYEYFPNGQLHWKYLETGSKDRDLYYEVYSEGGKLRYAKNESYGYESFYDHYTDRTIQRKYVAGRLKESIVFNNDNEIQYYQLAKKNAAMYQFLSERLIYRMELQDSIIVQSGSGTAYVRVLIGEKNNLIEVDVIKGFNTTTNEMIETAIVEVCEDSNMWKSARGREKIKVRQEIIIPVIFNVKTNKKETDNPVNYWYQNPYWNQFYMFPHTPTINPPKSFGR